jgi:hypothetical protein
VAASAGVSGDDGMTNAGALGAGGERRPPKLKLIQPVKEISVAIRTTE